MGSSSRPPVGFTETEILGLLPSGWGLRSLPSWDARRRVWTFVLYDGADQLWPVEIDVRRLEYGQRLDALKAAIDRVARRGLGRKNLLG